VYAAAVSTGFEYWQDIQLNAWREKLQSNPACKDSEPKLVDTRQTNPAFKDFHRKVSINIVCAILIPIFCVAKLQKRVFERCWCGFQDCI
jgi:hypothetical protein